MAKWIQLLVALFIMSLAKGQTSVQIDGHLRVGTFFNPLGRIKNVPNTSKGLIEKDLLEILAAAMNFTYNTVVPTDGILQFGAPRNGTWSGVLGHLDRGKTDITISFGPVSHVRFLAFDSTVGIVADNVVVVIPYPKQAMDGRAFISSFSPSTWAVIFTSTAATTLAIWFVDQVNRDAEDKLGIGLLTIYIISVFLSQGGRISHKSFNVRIILTPWLLSMVVLSYAYNGSIIARLAAPKHPLLINSIEDAAANQNIMPMVVKESSVQEEFTLSPLSVFQEIVQRWRKYPQILLQDSNRMVDLIANKPNHIFIGGDVNAKGNIEKDKKIKGKCRAILLPDKLIARNNGLFLSKNSRWTSAFNIELLRLQQSGLMRQLEVRYSSSSPACSVASLTAQSSRPVALNLTQLRTAFYALTCGCCISVVAFIFEILHHFKKQFSPVMSIRQDSRRLS